MSNQPMTIKEFLDFYFEIDPDTDDTAEYSELVWERICDYDDALRLIEELCKKADQE